MVFFKNTITKTNNHNTELKLTKQNWMMKLIQIKLIQIKHDNYRIKDSCYVFIQFNIILTYLEAKGELIFCS